MARSARDYVIHVAGNLFVQALAASARADAARAQQETARTLHQQALDLKQSGIIAGIDVLRAEVQLGAQTQRTSNAVNEFEKAKLTLARVIGLPLGQRFELDPDLPNLPVSDISVDAAVSLAYATRPDYKAALERVASAEAARHSVADEVLPSIRVDANYGDIGFTPSDSRATFAVTGAVVVPIFNGGRTKGRLLEADADLRNRRAEADDLKASIYYEVRTAFLDLEATATQLALAGKTRDLANQQLTQARDRFAAGVANNIEIVQAQDAVAAATEQFIAAQYGFDLAKGALVRGTGTSEDLLASASRRLAVIMLQQPRVRLIIGVVLLLILGAGLWAWSTSGREVTDDAQVDAHVTQLAARVSGTVTKVAVDDNQLVEAGTLLVQARSERLPGRGRQGARRAR